MIGEYRLINCAVKGEAWGIGRAVKILLTSPVRNAEQNGDLDGFGRNLA